MGPAGNHREHVVVHRDSIPHARMAVQFIKTSKAESKAQDSGLKTCLVPLMVSRCAMGPILRHLPLCHLVAMVMAWMALAFRPIAGSLR